MIAKDSPSVAPLLGKLEKMLDQQIWRWGCDIKHDSGNLLVEYGFERFPPPEELQECSSVYRLGIASNTRRLLLRGFGLFYGDDAHGGLMLKRFQQCIYRTPSADLACLPFEQTDLPFLMPTELVDTDTRNLLCGVLEQIAEYESWVRDEYGVEYIAQTLSDRSKRPAVPADEEIAAWQTLATQLMEVV